MGAEDFLMIFQGFLIEPPRPWSGASAGSGDGCGGSLAGAEGTDGNKAFPKRREFGEFGILGGILRHFHFFTEGSDLTRIRNLLIPSLPILVVIHLFDII